MTPQEFQNEAFRTVGWRKQELRHNRMALAMVGLGLCGETQEVTNVASRDEAIKEAGDIYWYLAIGCEVIGISFEDQCHRLRVADFVNADIIKSACEFADQAKKVAFQGHEFDYELSGRLVRLTIMLGLWIKRKKLKMSDVFQANVDKLRKRYPDGFSAERSVNR